MIRHGTINVQNSNTERLPDYTCFLVAPTEPAQVQQIIVQEAIRVMLKPSVLNKLVKLHESRILVKGKQIRSLSTQNLGPMASSGFVANKLSDQRLHLDLHF